MQRTLVAGDTLKFSVTLADYPASAGWVLHYRLTPATTGTAITFDAAADGDAQAVNVPATTTQSWPAGVYTCGAWVTNAAGERYSISSEGGQVTIQPDPANLQVGTDTRSQAQQALDAIRAKLLGKATDAVESYTIAGRQLRYYTPEQLLQLEKFWSAQVEKENVAAGIASATGGAKRILVRMGR